MFKIKYTPTGEVDRFKARLVARGYNQEQGVDFYESFSPVARTVTMRMLIVVAAMKQWELHQIDINNAYLYGHIEEDIYLEPPLGYNKAKEGQVCKLKKSLYGLKQQGRQWHKELSNKLTSYGFNRSSNDYCLFTKGTHDSLLILVIYVDDILISGQTQMILLMSNNTYTPCSR